MPGPTRAQLTGVWPDGTLPGQSRLGSSISFEVGTDGVIAISVVNAAGTAKDISAAVLTLAISGGILSGRLGTIDNGPAGTAHFDLAQVDTYAKTPGQYQYDVSCVIGGIREMLTIIGSFVLLPTVASIGAPTNGFTPSAVYTLAGGLPKAGVVTFAATSLGGFQAIAVTFTTPYTSAAGYAIGLTSSADTVDGASIKADHISKTASGFTIRVPDTFTGTVDWTTNATSNS